MQSTGGISTLQFSCLGGGEEAGAHFIKLDTEVAGHEAPARVMAVREAGDMAEVKKVRMLPF